MIPADKLPFDKFLTLLSGTRDEIAQDDQGELDAHIQQRLHPQRAVASEFDDYVKQRLDELRKSRLPSPR
jgi:hypothetical protein